MIPIIIKGYKGVMPLDLSGIEPKYHKIMVDQHYKDIEAYKIEESNLPINLRYENTTERAMNLLQKDREWLKQLADKKRLEYFEKDKQYLERNDYLQKHN